MTLLGPNTVGYFNFIDSFHVMMIDVKAAPQLARDSGPAHGYRCAKWWHWGPSERLATGSVNTDSYMMTTGNEAHLNLSDVAGLPRGRQPDIGHRCVRRTDSITRFFSLRGPAGARQWQANRLLLHSGTSEKGKAATSSHTGALAGNLAAMRLAAQQAGIAVVQTLEELMDVGQLLLRSASPSVGGLGVLTASGALCALTEDYIVAYGL